MGVRIELFGRKGSGKSLLVEQIRTGLRMQGLSVSIPFEGGEYGHALDVAGAPGETIAETLFPGTHDRPAPEHLKPQQAAAWRASRRGLKALDRACADVIRRARTVQATRDDLKMRDNESLSAYLARTNPTADQSKPEPEPEGFQPTDWPKLTLYGRWAYPNEKYSGYSTTTFDHGVSFVVCGGDTITVYTVQGHKFEAARTDASESAYRRWAGEGK